MLELLIAGLLSSTPPQQPAPPQSDDIPTRLEDITVVGRPLTSLIRDFVGEVAAPNRGRNLARWEDEVCVGVANMQSDAAQYVVDRISTVAEDLGLQPGAPGCRPNILIVATTDANSLAQALVERRPRAFRPGGVGTDQGAAALRDFQNSDRPVRWWSVSAPVDSDTGAVATRLPGDCQGACASIFDMAPVINIDSPSRLRTQIVDNLMRVVVIVDVNQIQNVSALQLADYIAMVTLAQINPDADTGSYATILNVFDDPQYAESLTDWDLSYLDGLYSAQRGRASVGANRDEVVRSIRRSHEDLRAADQS